MALGDSLTDSARKNEDMHEIHSICRSWDDFHDCANVAMAGCPEEAAAVWESLRQESKKMQFSGNLYDMCSNRHLVAPAPPHGSPNQEEINQESLRGGANHMGGSLHLLMLLSPLVLLWLSLWI
uniref:Neuritin 1-like a n=2 Tax=Salarias fasciatus TaxID=181472 RepID=A0A672GVK7_SALFA